MKEVTPKKGGRGKKESENLVMFKGAMVDIPSMVQRLEKSEKLKRDTDTKLKDLQEEMGEKLAFVLNGFSD